MQAQHTALLSQPVGLCTIALCLRGAELGDQELLCRLVDALELQDGAATSLLRLSGVDAPHLGVVNALGDLELVLEDFGDLLRRQDKAGGMPWVNTTC